MPDEPKTNSLVPNARDYYGMPSNSIYDWCKNSHFDWVPPVELTKINDLYVFKCKNDADNEMGIDNLLIN